MEWTGIGVEMEWKGVEKRKRTKVNWEDEWITIPPTPLNRPWLVMTGLNSFYFIYLVYNRWEDKDEGRGERRGARGEKRERRGDMRRRGKERDIMKRKGGREGMNLFPSLHTCLISAS